MTDGDPEGAREAKNIVNMAPDTTVITVMNPTMFYDDGGKDNPVTVKFKGVTIFKPGKENCAIKIEPIKFSTGSGKFYIYNGEGVDNGSKSVHGMSSFFFCIIAFCKTDCNGG